jgi:hypothetical protein
LQRHVLLGVAGTQREQHQPQQQPGHAQECWSPKHAWPLDLSAVPQPNFELVGVAIGNGLTDPKPQTRALASELFSSLRCSQQLRMPGCCGISNTMWGQSVAELMYQSQQVCAWPANVSPPEWQCLSVL